MKVKTLKEFIQNLDNDFDVVISQIKIIDEDINKWERYDTNISIVVFDHESNEVCILSEEDSNKFQKMENI